MTSANIDSQEAGPTVIAQRLAPEILTNILQHLKGSVSYSHVSLTHLKRCDAVKTLLACTLVCKAWTQPALAQLYADLRIFPDRYSKLVFDKLKASFCHGYLVRRLTVDTLESLELLSFTPNLQQLEVSDCHGSKPVLDAWLPPTMTTLSSLGLYDIPPLTICPLLSASPALSSLSIIDIRRSAFEKEAVWLAYNPAAFQLHTLVLHISNCNGPLSATGPSKIMEISRGTLQHLTLQVVHSTAEDESAWLTAWLPSSPALKKLHVDVDRDVNSLGDPYFDMVIPFQSAIRDAWQRRCVRKGLL
ncbi:hypothetical protein EMMF5_002269 [Cystobasidiomycetes sp. EMM_F5]